MIVRRVAYAALPALFLGGCEAAGDQSLGWLPILVIGILMIRVALVRIPREQRALVHRSGRAHRIAGPGWILALPFLERVERLDGAALPDGWEALTNQEIFDRLDESLS